MAWTFESTGPTCYQNADGTWSFVGTAWNGNLLIKSNEVSETGLIVAITIEVIENYTGYFSIGGSYVAIPLDSATGLFAFSPGAYFMHASGVGTDVIRFTTNSYAGAELTFRASALGRDGASSSPAHAKIKILEITVDGESVFDGDTNAQGGISETGGGTGTFDATSDSLDFNSPPTLTAVDAGFISLFNPTLAELKSLANYMWANLFSWDSIKKLFADPIDAILGLNIVPVAVPNGGRRTIKICGISTNVDMTLAASQYVTVNCGSVTISEYWGSALDYSPYTKIQLFLPYIGTVHLDTDDVMGRTISIQYKVDILTGACIAQIKSSGGTHSNVNAVLYNFSGHCAQSIPVTGVNFSQLISNIVGIATTAISAGITAGAAGAAVAAAGSSLEAAGAAATEYLAGDSVTSAGAVAMHANVSKALSHVKKAEAAQKQNIVSGISNTVGQVMGCKPSINHSGSISAVPGMLGIQKPYLIITRPRQSLAKKYKHYVGYPANITFKFSELTGFTSFEQIILDKVPATDPELSELYELLKGGVYF